MLDIRVLFKPSQDRQTNLVQIDDTHCVFNLDNPSTVNHVCVFLLGTQPFPEGWGATVHFHWPGRGYQLLGMLSNQKPSAIFRTRGLGQTVAQRDADDAMSDDTGDDAAAIGIAIDTLQSIDAQMATLPPSRPVEPSSTALALVPLPANPPQNPQLSDPIWLTERILKNLFNYVSSFTQDPGRGASPSVELATIQKWYENFLNKMKTAGTAFLERQE